MALYLNGRIIEYTGEVIFETDFLRSNLYNMVGVSGLAGTVLNANGSNATMVCGLPCTPISPPGMSVVIGRGEMYSLQDLDATDYGVLPADTNVNHKLYKQAFNFDPITIPLTAPPTPGDSVIYLIQGIFRTQDVNNISRPYFNSADPMSPIFNNNYDTRTDNILISAKQGTPGVSPAAPSPDAGYTGLYYVTIANGQTTIISGDIAKVSTAEGQPFITEGLTDKVSSGTIATGYVSIPNQQKSTYVYGSDVGSVNAIAVNPANVYPAYVAGTFIDVLIANTNTGAATLNISAHGAVAIRAVTPLGLTALSGGEIPVGMIARFQYDGTFFQLLNPSCKPSYYAKVAFQAASTQTISGNTTASPAKIVFDNVLNDPNSWWDAGNFRFIPNITGKFRINGIAHLFGTTAVQHYVSVAKNGTIATQLSANDTIGGTLSGSTILTLNGSTDYAELFFGSGATVIIGGDGSSEGAGNIANLFEIEYLGL